jgi:uncharacterized OB-fold protein
MNATTTSAAATETPLYARCPVCHEASFPVHVLSPCGHGGDPILEPLTATGTVYSWTRSHSADGATLIAMADFLDGELRVTAPVLGADAVAIDDRLTVVTGGDLPFALAPAAD